MSDEEEKDYEIGYCKPPIATRFKKGVCPNPAGRGKKPPPELDPGKVIQQFDNEEMVIVVDGKRKSMRYAEINFRQLFGDAIKGNLTAARTIAKMAAEYFGPEAQGPGQVRFIVKRDRESRELESQTGVNDSEQRKQKSKRSGPRKRRSSRKLEPTPEQVATSVMFRRVAKDLVPIGLGEKRTKISYWEAYVRQIGAMALNRKTSAARLLDQLRRQFPGDLLPGDPITYLLRPSDHKL